MREKLYFGRYDFAGFFAFIAYSMCSLVIPLSIVAMGKSLDFPLDDGGKSAAGTLHLVRSIGIVVTLLFCGMIGGCFGKRKTMGFSMLLMGAGIVLCAISPMYALLIPLLFIAGLGEGICEGLATPFVQDLHPEASERYVNIAHSMWSVGIALCVTLTAVLLTLGVSWRIVVLICGVCGLLSGLTFLWRENPAKKYPENPQKENPADIIRHSKAIIKVPRFWWYCLGMFVGAGAEFCLTFWAAAYLQLVFNASVWVASIGTGAIACGMFIGRVGFGYFAKKEYLKHILLFTSLGTLPLTLLLIFLKPEFFPDSTVFFTIIIAILFLCGIGIAPYWPTLQVYGVNQLPALDSTMLYIYFSAMGIPGCGFFTWIMGVFGDNFGLTSAFLLIPASLLLFAAVIFLEGWCFRKPEQKSCIPAQ